MNNEINTLELYEHNQISYKKIKEAFKTENVVGIVHATGTGKTYNALKLCLENKDKKIIYVVPSNGIIEHIKEIIKDNNLDYKLDFQHVEFRTYQSFVNMSKKELEDLNCDLLILDEFHHIGAPVWGNRVDTIIKTHSNIKIFGMTAYTIRDRGKIDERDMANPETNELFSNKIVSRYDLCDAMIDGLVPKPIYKSAYIKLEDTCKKLETKLEKINTESKDYKECKQILNTIKKRIHTAPSIKDLIKRNIKSNGKYIYFCPPNDKENSIDIDAIMTEAKNWFLEMGLKEEDIIFYKSTSEMNEKGKINRDAFYKDLDLTGDKVNNKLRIMFAINQYNEGVHAPNLDGVIMGRGTNSDIVYFEQLGRALSANKNINKRKKELEQLTKEELADICKTKSILINETTTKEEIIEKLTSPLILDLTNNYEFIKELENNLKERIKEKEKKETSKKNKKQLKNYSFDIELINQDLYETLRYVMDRTTMTWLDRFELAKIYYEKNYNLNIPSEFKTIDGYTYDENGINIGHWIRNLRYLYHYDRLSPDKIKLLESIKMNFAEQTHDKWNQMYNLATIYYKHHQNLKVPARFKTVNGYTKDENGLDLGRWIRLQMRNYKTGILSQSRIKLLKKLEMNFESNHNELEWNRMYNLASNYYKHHKNLEIPASFKTKDGYTRDETGINLGAWIFNQRKRYEHLSKEKKKLLNDLNLRLNTIDYEKDWENKYTLAKSYYKHHKNLLIPVNFKTINGYDYDETGITLGRWLMGQKNKFDKLTKEKQDKLFKIGFILNVHEQEWLNMYNLATIFYKEHNHLRIPALFKTKDGIYVDRNGYALGTWISTQRQNFGKLTKEKQELLLGIGFIINIKSNRELIKEICNNNNIDIEKNKSILSNISYQELIAKINYLKENNIELIKNDGILHDIFNMASLNMKVLFNYTLEEIIKKYYINNKEKSV